MPDTILIAQLGEIRGRLTVRTVGPDNTPEAPQAIVFQANELHLERPEFMRGEVHVSFRGTDTRAESNMSRRTAEALGRLLLLQAAPSCGHVPITPAPSWPGHGDC